MRALASGAGSSMQRLAACQRGELSRNRLGEVVVVQVARRGKDHVAAVKAVAVIGEKLFLVELGHRLRGAQNRPAQRMVLPESLREKLVNQHVRVVFVDLDLFQNHTALALDVRGGEDRVKHQVGQHIQSDGHVVAQRLDVEADGFLAGKGVQVAADRVHLAGNVLGRARAGALEKHVLDKVRDAVGLGGLAAGAGLDPHAHGHRTQMFHALGQNNQAVRQYGAAKVALGGHRHPSNSIVGPGLERALCIGRFCFCASWVGVALLSASTAKCSILSPAVTKFDQLVQLDDLPPGGSMAALPEAPSRSLAWIQRRSRPNGGGGRTGLAWPQLAEAIYRQRIAESSEITTLPKTLRQRLAAEGWEVGRPGIVQVFQSVDGTERYLVRAMS